MKIKKILSGIVAGTLALSTLAGMSLSTSAAEEAPAALKTWMTDASTKSSAWCGGMDADPFAFGGAATGADAVEIPVDLSKANSFEVTLKTPTDNINGSFGVGVGTAYTWSSADWSIGYDYDAGEWMLEDSDSPAITVSATSATPSADNVITVAYTDLATILGGTPGVNAGAELKVNGFNRIGTKNAWVETTTSLISLVVKDADGNVLLSLPAAEEEDYTEDASVVKYQTANNGDTVRFVYVADEATVAAAATGSVEMRIGADSNTTPVTTAYRAIKAGGATVKADAGKVFIISPVVENVQSAVTGIFSLDGAAKVGRTYTK